MSADDPSAADDGSGGGGGGGRRHNFPTSVAPGTVPPRKHLACDVCGEEADRPHLNYGANACFSCRAFFRRAHNDGSMERPQFVCKSGGGCDITPKNRRRCQKCRYVGCEISI